jgi:hypothetical protein
MGDEHEIRIDAFGFLLADFNLHWRALGRLSFFWIHQLSPLVQILEANHRESRQGKGRTMSDE